MKFFIRCMALLASVALVTNQSTSAFAQDKQVQTDLPSAEAVMDAYVEAMGGKEAFEKLKTRKIKATFSMPAAGVNAPLTLIQAAPNKLRTEISIPGLGDITQICDGENVYEKNPITGERLLEGGEKEAALLEASFQSDAAWKENLKSVKMLGKEDVDGKPCYKLEMMTKGGLKRTAYIDAETNMMVMNEMTIESPQGKIAVTNQFSDFKEVDGITLPHKTQMSMLGQKQTIAIQQIEHGVEIPADTFKIPNIGG